jgi:pimeloyl-ACP methyl ester carboxylesterase
MRDTLARAVSDTPTVRTKLLLLPGLDGTGSLFAPFLSALPPRFEAEVARYAFDETSYETLCERVRLPDGDFVIVAESFSGPLGVMVAAACARVTALVLVATFARNPTPLTLLGPLLNVLPSPPPRLAEAMMTNGAPLPALASVLREVPRQTLVRRLEAVRTCDVSDALRGLTIPRLLLRPERDRLVPRNAFDHLERAGVPGVPIAEAPHLVLQTAPMACARVLETFVPPR